MNPEVVFTIEDLKEFVEHLTRKESKIAVVFNKKLKYFFVTESWGRDTSVINAVAYDWNRVNNQFNERFLWLWSHDSRAEFISWGYKELNRDTIMAQGYTLQPTYVALVKGNVPF